MKTTICKCEKKNVLLKLVSLELFDTTNILNVLYKGNKDIFDLSFQLHSTSMLRNQTEQLYQKIFLQDKALFANASIHQFYNSLSSLNVLTKSFKPNLKLLTLQLALTYPPVPFPHCLNNLITDWHFLRSFEQYQPKEYR